MRSPLLVRRVVGTSMLPTLRPGQLIVATAWPSRPRPGELVVVRHGGRELIKRIEQTRPGQLFVVGDNPPASTDSRQFGWLNASAVIARVVLA